LNLLDGCLVELDDEAQQQKNEAGQCHSCKEKQNKLKHFQLKFNLIFNVKNETFMFGTNSICYQRPKAGYET
jgi:hypothetical protein